MHTRSKFEIGVVDLLARKGELASALGTTSTKPLGGRIDTPEFGVPSKSRTSRFWAVKNIPASLVHTETKMSTHKPFEAGIELHLLSIIGYNRNINEMRPPVRESRFCHLKPPDADRLVHTSLPLIRRRRGGHPRDVGGTNQKAKPPRANRGDSDSESKSYARLWLYASVTHGSGTPRLCATAASAASSMSAASAAFARPRRSRCPRRSRRPRRSWHLRCSRCQWRARRARRARRLLRPRRSRRPWRLRCLWCQWRPCHHARERAPVSRVGCGVEPQW